MVTGLILSRPLPRVVAPSRTCQFQLDEDKGSRRDFALAAATACRVLPDRWFIPHFAVYAEFALSAWDATVDGARVFHRFGQLVGLLALTAPDVLRHM